MDRNGIISVGNWLVDSVKLIDKYPARGNLITIQHVETGLGGCAHNVLVDLAHLKSGIPLYAGGCIGPDVNGHLVLEKIRENNINADHMHVVQDVATSYTDVMSEIRGESTRTFFHYRGANAKLSPEHIDPICVPAKIFHLGYLLLLDELDKKEDKYGIVAARVLHDLQCKGYKTSVDVVSEEGDRFREIILPCLKYVDYLIVNEVEAGACCCMQLRDKNGIIQLDKMKSAARILLNKGVGELCVIHFPEGGYAMTKSGDDCFVAAMMLLQPDIISTVGAGDAFCAGVLYAVHQNMTLRNMLVLANTSARFNLRSATSTEGAPTLQILNDFIIKNYETVRN